MNSIYNETEFLRFNYNEGCGADPLPRTVIPYVDLTYVINGELTYVIDNEPVAVKSGNAIILPPKSIRHRFESESNANFASFNIKLPDNFLIPIMGKVENAFRSNTQYMLETVRKNAKSISPHKTDKCLSAFFYLYYQLLEIATDKENPHIKSIKQYINNHLCESITLGMISAEVHLVERYICSFFKKHTGMTVVEYINSERIDLAKRLIIANDMPLYKIAEECGFADYNYFTRTFKKHTGVSAGAYKKSMLPIIDTSLNN